MTNQNKYLEIQEERFGPNSHIERAFFSSFSSYNINFELTKETEPGKHIIVFSVPFSSKEYNVDVVPFWPISYIYRIIDEFRVEIRFIDRSDKKKIIIDDKVIFECACLVGIGHSFKISCWKIPNDNAA